MFWILCCMQKNFPFHFHNHLLYHEDTCCHGLESLINFLCLQIKLVCWQNDKLNWLNEEHKTWSFHVSHYSLLLLFQYFLTYSQPVYDAKETALNSLWGSYLYNHMYYKFLNMLEKWIQVWGHMLLHLVTGSNPRSNTWCTQVSLIAWWVFSLPMTTFKQTYVLYCISLQKFLKSIFWVFLKQLQLQKDYFSLNNFFKIFLIFKAILTIAKVKVKK